MVVQTPSAQSFCNLLRGFCSHTDSIANNPSELQKCRLHPWVQTQLEFALAQNRVG
jgi:hypothetical protein